LRADCYEYGIIRLIFGASASETKVGISSWRLRLRFFEVRMWRVKACVRRTLPVPVLRKRFFAPECDLSFGISKTSVFSVLLLGRREDGVERVAFHARHEFHDAFALDLFHQAVKDLAAQLAVTHFASAVEDGRLYFVAFLEEAQHVVFLGLVIVLVHVDAELHFLDGDDFLVFLGRFFLLIHLVEIFAEVHDLADWRLRRRRDFYEVEVALAGDLERVEGRQDAELFTFRTDHAQLARADTVIGANKLLVDAILRKMLAGAGTGLKPRA